MSAGRAGVISPREMEVLNFPPEETTLSSPEPPPLIYSAKPSTPLVIDFGSNTLRAGWGGDADPAIMFRSLTCKARAGGGDMLDVVGDQVLLKDIAKSSLRSPFEKDIVQHFDSAELLLDYTMHRLGINTESVLHPVLMTECLCNPNYCRSKTCEILFEAYGAPSAAFAVDALLSYDHMSPTPSPSTGLLSVQDGLSLKLGHSSCYVIPISKGKAEIQHGYRQTVAGLAVTSSLHSLLGLRWPVHRPSLTWNKALHIKEELCFCAQGPYSEEIRTYENLATCQGKLRKMQLPYTEKEVPVLTEEDKLRRKRQRQEAAERLREMARAKREKQMESLRETLTALAVLLPQSKTAKGKELAALNEKLVSLGVPDVKALPKAVLKAAKQYEEVKGRHVAKGYTVPGGDDDFGLGDLNSLEQDTKMVFDLVDRPDAELSDEQRVEKRKQKLLRGAALAREAEKKRKDEEKAEKERAKQEQERVKRLDPQAWLQVARGQRLELIAKRDAKLKAKQAAVTGGERRGEAANERMKAIISTLAGAEDSKKRTNDGCADDGSDFGEEDEDWDVYRAIRKDEPGEEEEEEEDDDEKIAELDAAIMEIDDKHVPLAIDSEGDSGASQAVLTKEDFQIELSTELCQCPEVIMNPSMIGVDSCSLSELIGHALSRYTQSQREAMARNIVVSGGSSLFPGMMQRLEYELRSLLPYGCDIVVKHSSDTSDAWRSAARLAGADAAASPAIWMTKQEYEEMGVGYFKEHRCSNVYVATPSAS